MTKFGKIISFLVFILLVGIGIFALNYSVSDTNPPNPIPEIIPTPLPLPEVNNLLSEFNKEILFKINDTKTFSDGFTLKLKEINDSRCKPDVQCIWAGELAGTFLVSGGAFSPSVEIILGTTNNKSVTLKGYTFTLKSATENSMTINVSNNNTLVGNDSYIKGHITIGPNCPVERADEPCKTPPEAYSSRQVIVYKSDGVTIQQKIKIDSQGNYLVAELPGKYFLQVSPAGIGPGEKKPVTVKQSSTDTVNFDIDTGIR